MGNGVDHFEEEENFPCQTKQACICFAICNNGPSSINVGTTMPAIAHSHSVHKELCPITSTVILPLFLKPSLLGKVRGEVKRAVELPVFFRFGINI